MGVKEELLFAAAMFGLESPVTVRSEPDGHEIKTTWGELVALMADKEKGAGREQV